MISLELRRSKLSAVRRPLPLGRGHVPSSRPNNLAIASRITSRERDPELDEILHAIANSGFSLDVIAERATVCKSTLDKWFKQTKRPHNYTLDQVWMALGYETIRRKK